MTRALTRLLGAPLSWHAGLLLVVLLALLPFARADTVFFADEGSGLAQAQQLSDGDGWSRPLSFPEADPQRTSFPLFNSGTVDRVIPLGQHPTYAVALVPWFAAAGPTGTALLSVGALTAASLVGACIARRVRPGIEVAALWAIGVTSPLFLDGYLTVGHTLAAALAAATALAILRFCAGEHRLVMGAGAVFLAIGTGLVRNEGVLYAIALGVTLLVVGMRRRDRALAGLGALVACAAEGSRIINAVLQSRVVDAQNATQFGVTTKGGWIGSHVQSTFITLLLPSYGKFDVGDVLLILGVVCAIVAAVIARRRPEDRSGLLLFAGLAVGLVAARLLVTPAPVPGVFLACPLLGIALALADRRTVRKPDVAMLGAVTVLYAGAVLLTQYGAAGGREWGWRYFSLALPVAVPLALVLIVDGAARISTADRRVAGRLLVALCAAIGLLAFLSLREVRGDDRQIVDGIRAAYQSTPAADGGKPVVVTTQAGTLDRFSWKHVDETRWLIVDPDDRSQLGPFLDRIAALGVDQVTFVTSSLDADRPFVEAHGEVVDERALPDDHRVLTVRLRRP